MYKRQGLGELVAEMEAEFPCSGEINLPANHVNAILEAIEKKYTPDAERIYTVSYTHLDVYKRQVIISFFNISKTSFLF